MAQYPMKVMFRRCDEGSFHSEPSGPQSEDRIDARLRRLIEEELDKDTSEIEVELETGKGSTGRL